MESSDIQIKIIQQLAVLLDKDTALITPDTLLQSLGMDSMRLVELFIFVEKEFGVELISSDMQSEDLKSPAALAASIARNI